MNINDPSSPCLFTPDELNKARALKAVFDAGYPYVEDDVNFAIHKYTLPSLFVCDIGIYYADDSDRRVSKKNVTCSTLLSQLKHHVGIYITHDEADGLADDATEGLLKNAFPDWIEESGSEGILVVNEDHDMTLGALIDTLHQLGLRIEPGLFCEDFKDMLKNKIIKPPKNGLKP